MGYTNVSISDILTHLQDSYGVITQDDLTKNTLELDPNWDPETPIETVMAKAIQCQRFATAGGDPISDATWEQQGLSWDWDPKQQPINPAMPSVQRVPRNDL